jgi:hypothetical protein
MIRNTLSDFWGTMADDALPITCPACGNAMSLGNEASYRLIIKSDLISILNGHLDCARLYFTMVDNEILRYFSKLGVSFDISTPVFPSSPDIDPTGSYQGDAASATRLFAEAHSEHKLSFHVPGVLQVIEKKVNHEVIEKLIGLYIDPKITGNILEILLSQPSVFEWFRTVDVSINSEDHRNVIKNILPGLAETLERIASISQDIQLPEKDLQKIHDNLNKLIKLGILLLGHSDDSVLRSFNLVSTEIQANTSTLNITTDVPYYLQSGSIFTGWKQLGSFITNLARINGMNEYGAKLKSFLKSEYKIDEILESLKNHKIGQQFEPGKSLNDAHIKHKDLSDIIKWCVEPACAGKPTSIPREAKIKRIVGNELKEETVDEITKDQLARKVCAWTPKEEPTLSILLIGGTGSSKSAITQSALVNIKRRGSTLGFDFMPTTPLDEVLATFYEDFYDGKEFPSATKAGSRSSLGFTLLESSNPGKRIHVIVNDIAGEQFERILLEGKPDAVIDGCFRSADQIVFIFDLVFWRQLSVSATSSEWAPVWEQKNKLQSDGRGLVDTHNLFLSVSNKLEQSYPKSTDGKPPIKRGLTVLIPKCDFYIQDNMFLKEWHEALIKSDYLAKVENTDSDDSYESAWWKAIRHHQNASKPEEHRHELALSVIDDISDQAVKSIQTLHQTMGTDANNADAGNLAALINNSLIEHAQKRFETFKMMPVAAIGSDPLKLEVNKSSRGKIKAGVVSPLFPEAVFLLPVLMARKNNGLS